MPTDWSIKGPAAAMCNCDYGCPCQFMARPTRGDCRATMAMRIEDGHFGGTRLAGVTFGLLAAWPGAIHEGRGEVLPVVDEHADEAQREAVLHIMKGEETEPGATVFNVFATTFEKVHAPRFAPIAFDIDVGARKARITIPGLVEAHAEPIRNPVTGAEHRARVTLPHGFEYTEAEYASGSAKAAGMIPLDWDGRHSHLSVMHLTPSGPVR